MNILVVGANGAIGQAVVEAFCEQYSSAVVYAVSRSHYTGAKRKQVVPVQLDTVNETAITNWLSACKAKGTAFTHAVIATGVLHDDNVTPEKRLEDVSAEAMQHYFQVNTIGPSLWVKLLVGHLAQGGSTVSVLIARNAQRQGGQHQRQPLRRVVWLPCLQGRFKYVCEDRER